MSERQKTQLVLETALLSETSLAEDWLNSKEDEAWQGL